MANYLLAPLLILAACAGPTSRTGRHELKGLRFVYADGAKVDAHCRKYGKNWDSGVPIAQDPRPGALIRCCTRFHRRLGYDTVFVAHGGADCIPHELCHVQNPWDPKKCHTVHMDPARRPLE